MKVPSCLAGLLPSLGGGDNHRSGSRNNSRFTKKRRSATFAAGVFLQIDGDAMKCEETDCDEDSMSHATPTPSAPPLSWKSTTRRSFLKKQPLCVNNPDHPSEEITDEAAALCHKMQQSQDLPRSSWYYSSNHIMVNVERRNHVVAPVTRRADLDELAREHAAAMAQKGQLFHTDPAAVLLRQSPIASSSSSTTTTTRIMGENVATGETIRAIHQAMLDNPEQKSNMLHRRYTHFGMGTAKSSDGRLFLCQVYRGL